MDSERYFALFLQCVDYSTSVAVDSQKYVTYDCEGPAFCCIPSPCWLKARRLGVLIATLPCSVIHVVNKLLCCGHFAIALTYCTCGMTLINKLSEYWRQTSELSGYGWVGRGTRHGTEYHCGCCFWRNRKLIQMFNVPRRSGMARDEAVRG